MINCKQETLSHYQPDLAAPPPVSSRSMLLFLVQGRQRQTDDEQSSRDFLYEYHQQVTEVSKRPWQRIPSCIRANMLYGFKSLCISTSEGPAKSWLAALHLLQNQSEDMHGLVARLASPLSGAISGIVMASNYVFDA